MVVVVSPSFFFIYLQAECDSDQHPAGGHDTVAGPEQRPPACVLDQKTLEEDQEESNIQTRFIRPTHV